ncbi:MULTISPECIES: hypothetical protein [Bacillus]|nr:MULTISPECIES: hypothetical protein [Bacillus]MEC0672792.1 hypothetical protein [Bacillus haynesii]
MFDRSQSLKGCSVHWLDCLQQSIRYYYTTELIQKEQDEGELLKF